MTAENRRGPGFYGAAVEDWVLDHYGLERSYDELDGARLDAVEPTNGQPVEIKAVALNRKGGRANQVRFKIWRDQHSVLKSHNGYYVFVAYYLQPSSIAVQHSRSLRASSLSINWYGDTVPRGSEQAEIRASTLFG